MHEGYFFTYIIASRSLTLYIGMTGDLRKRMFEHKRKLHEGFTAQYNCNRLVWFERFVDPSNAIDREKQLKRWSRSKKITLIKRENPTWIDLSAEWFTEFELTWTPNQEKLSTLHAALNSKIIAAPRGSRFTADALP